MITAEMAAREMSTGMSAVCAWCEHWHEAKDRGEVVACGKNCGGPGAGMGFPMYKGPLGGNLHMFCFICGKTATSGADIGGRILGVCNRMGPGKETCLDKLKRILSRSGIVISKEIVVPGGVQ